MRIKLTLLFIMFLALQGCSPALKNPQLERAADFEKGVSNIPKGYFIFLELSGSNVCSDECHCAPAPVRPAYNFTASGELWTDLESLPAALASPTVGFFGYGNWRDKLFIMDALPFNLQPYDDTTVATLYSVDAQGTAIVEIAGETYFIKPGQSWTDSGEVRQEPPAGCHVSYTRRLTNYGLLPQTQIQFGDPGLH
jgi:hypothetical protein